MFSLNSSVGFGCKKQCAHSYEHDACGAIARANDQIERGAHGVSGQEKRRENDVHLENIGRGNQRFGGARVRFHIFRWFCVSI